MTHYDFALKTVAAFNTAAELGEQHGRSAGEWWWQDAVASVPATTNRPVRDFADTIKQQLDDGDPLLFDSLPALDLSGQWADGWTPDRLYRYCYDSSPEDEDEKLLEELLEELCDHYEQAFHSAVQNYVDGAATRELEPTE